MDKVKVAVCKVEGAEDLPLPRYMTSQSSGMDLLANIDRDVVLKPGEFKLIPSGIRIELPNGYEAQVRPRSGLAVKYGITVLNSPGTIDSDFRGEIKILIINHGNENFRIKRGDRIAQIIISKIARVEFIEKAKLDVTERNEGGFGHTGI